MNHRYDYDRIRTINAMRCFADIAEQCPDLPLPGQLMLLASSAEQIQKIGSLDVFCPVETTTTSGGTTTAKLYLGGLTVTVWHAEPTNAEVVA